MPGAGRHRLLSGDSYHFEREFVEGTDITEIALMLCRTEMEVVQLIEKLELYQRLDCRPGSRRLPYVQATLGRGNVRGRQNGILPWKIRQGDD
jgi:hypothetical protein